ncbi:precorrin-2 C(20)-methyltransferase [Peptoanaerobacter stomatis]|uniref:Precorrin-2 C(20)-methyltransferase n=1 Tax=Peptoanaerobacter stomatis TaxID=796937 RepID=J5UME2_9FIRM|nr:precorrin-2 C(20)-methyltransferase [Peptoanaerobacter stomatis]EJU23624.1 precorrin-2 C(20)-methyltransferase [Peptoanaerobacter stomatis]NWO24379.1 precorrin-2 C(20)-methyltransferase [Peptostreptococcaceae bacterium oral taxon 081]
MSKLYAIGVGTGDNSILTLKAVETLQKIDILYCPTSKNDNTSIAYTIAKKYIRDDVQIKNRHFPMIRDKQKLEVVFDEIADEIKKDVQLGKEVGFVTIGDAMIYSTFIYILRKLKDEIDIITISGIPSFVDVASKTNFPIAFDDNAFVVVPATTSIQKLEEYIISFDSIVIMKAYKNYNDIIALIKKYNLQDNTIVVSNASLENEIILQGEEIFNKKNEDYLTTVLINKNF